MRKTYIFFLCILGSAIFFTDKGYRLCILPFHRMVQTGPTQRRLKTVSEYLQQENWEMAGKESVEGLAAQEISLAHLTNLEGKTPIHTAAQATSAILTLPEKFDFSPESLFPIALFAELSLPTNKTFRKFGKIEVQYDAKRNRLFIHPGEKFLLGEGRKKKVYKTILYDRKHPIIMARGVSECNVLKEMRAMEALHGLPGLIQAEGLLQHRDPSSKKRLMTIITRIYNGDSLDSFLKNRRLKLTLKEKVKIARDVTQGLVSMHSHRYVHRDLGARNYFVHVTGQGASRTIDAVVADMGRTIPAETAAGLPVQGNKTYLAPEGIFRETMQGTDYYATDIFAVGCVLWNLFFETPPHWRKKHPYKKHLQDKQAQYSSFLALLEKTRSPHLQAQQEKKELSPHDQFLALVLQMTDPLPELRGSAEEVARQFQELFQKTRDLSSLP